MPSAPGYPPEQRTTERPAAQREYESFEWYEATRIIVPGGTAFTEVIAFSGRPDSIVIEGANNNHEVRLRNRGQAPGAPIALISSGVLELTIGAEIVEIRDVTGAGGQFFRVLGRF